MYRKKSASRNRGFSKGFLTFLLVVILAVGAGYIVTEYIITPYILGEKTQQDGDMTEQNQGDVSFQGSGIITDGQDVNEGDPSDTPTSSVPELESTDTDTISSQTVTLYCIQYGSFSSKAGAEEASGLLSGIETMVLEYDGSYKVIGNPYTQEQKAREALTVMKSVAGEDIFITTMEARIK